MARPLRIEYPGAWYHVLNRGRRREKVFFDDADYRFFLRLLGKCRQRFNVETHAYALLPNHYHLIVRTPQANVSHMMRYVNGVYTQYINRKYRLEGSLFKGRFKSILIERESYLLELVRYIHRNPFKARLEERIGQHRWTSHRAYMRKQERPKWLVVNGVLERFGEREKSALRELDLFVKKEPPRELEKRLDGMNWPAVLGGKGFKEKIKRVLLGKELDFSEVPESRNYSGQKSAAEVLALVSSASGMSAADVVRRRVRETVKEKRALVYLCRSVYQVKGAEVRSILGGVSTTAVGKIYKLSLADMEKKRGCYQLVRKLEKR
jgi:putative transposase